MNLVYCDYIAHLTKKSLLSTDSMNLLSGVGDVKYDLDEHGAFVSTAKTIDLTDRNGTKYRITVQEL